MTVDDLAAYREIRLRALQSDPDAFGSSYEREAAFSDEEWRQRLSRGDAGGGWMALVDGKPVGIVGCYDFGVPGEVLIVSMWVAPEARRRGVAAKLIQAAIDWGKSREQTTRVALEVGDLNASAIALYEQLGFVDTGHRQPMPGRESLIERLYHMPIR